MRFLLLLLAACTNPHSLGGQDGEPYGGQDGEPAQPPAPAEFDDVDNDGMPDAGADCGDRVHCLTDDWCAEYTATSAPADLEDQCTDAGGTLEAGPCDAPATAGVCTLDSCNRVLLTTNVPEPLAFCEELGGTLSDD